MRARDRASSNAAGSRRYSFGDTERSTYVAVRARRSVEAISPFLRELRGRNRCSFLESDGSVQFVSFVMHKPKSLLRSPRDEAVVARSASRSVATWAFD